MVVVWMRLEEASQRAVLACGRERACDPEAYRQTAVGRLGMVCGVRAL